MNRAEKRALERNTRAKALFRPEDKPKVVALGYIYNEARGVSGMWHGAFIDLISAGPRLGVAFRRIAVESGPVLHTARNKVLETFLKNEDDYLLWLDTDMVFDAEALQTLMAVPADIAGALYFTGGIGLEPWCTALVEDESSSVPATFRPLVLPEAPPAPEESDEDAVAAYTAEIIENLRPRDVAAVGMGFTLMTRDVVAKLMAEYDGHPFAYEGDWGEDLTFCQRALQAGFTVQVVPLARVGHVKQAVV